MRTREDRLLESYEAQKLIFEQSIQRRKINMTENLDNLGKKLERLQHSKLKLQQDIEKLEKEEFLTFQQFQDLADSQAQKAKKTTK